MKSNLLIVIALFFFGTQNVYAFETPELVKLKSIKLEKLKNGKLQLSCTAVYFNPNRVKAKLTDIDLDIFFNDTKAGNIKQLDKVVKIPKQGAFDIPLTIEFGPETNASGYFSGFLTAFTNKNFLIKFKGYLKAKASGISVRIKLDESEEVNLKSIIVG